MMDTLLLLQTTQVLPPQWSSHNKGNGYSCIPLLSPCPGSVEYPMPYAFLSSLLQCCWVLLSLSSACHVDLCLIQHSLSKDLGYCSLFYQSILVVHSGIACLGLCLLGQLVQLPRPLIGQLHSGMACLACDWLIHDWVPTQVCLL